MVAVTQWSAQSAQTRQLIEMRARFDLDIGRLRLIALCRKHGIRDLEQIAQMPLDRLKTTIGLR